MIKLNRRALVIIVIAAFILLVIISLVLSSTSKKAPNLDSGTYYDKNSGETVSNPKGKAPDTYGVPSDQPIYLGISGLVESGLSEDQLTRLKYAFSNYSAQNKKNIKEVSVNKSSITPGPHPRNSTAPFSLSFGITFDRKDTYKARVEYTGLEDIRLYLYDQKTGVQIYDSGILGSDSETKH